MNVPDLMSVSSRPVMFEPALSLRKGLQAGGVVPGGQRWFNTLWIHLGGWSRLEGCRRLYAGLAFSWFAHDLIRSVGGGGPASLASLIQMVIHPVIFLWGFFVLAPAIWSASPWAGPKRILGCLVCAFFFFALLWGVEGVFRLAAPGKPIPLPTLFRDLLVSVPAMVVCGAALAQLCRPRSDHGRMAECPSQDRGHALLNQLHPHLLCNALNGLAELSKTRPEQVERSILDLSDFLRKVSEACIHPTHTLEEEGEMLEAYLDLGCPGLGSSLRVEWDWDESLNECRVPTLLLQPLLENALKHGGSGRSGHLICLRAQRAEDGEEDGLLLEVRNRGRLENRGAAPGVGLHNLRERLQAAYQGKASFSLQAEEGWTVARVRIPFAVLEQDHAA